MKVSDVMKTDMITVKLDATVVDAARLMRDHGIGFLPVCDENRRVQGVITDRDLVTRILAENRSLTTPIVDVMTLELVRCRSDDDVAAAASSMADTHKGRMLVTRDDDVLEGVFSLSDLAALDDTKAAETLRKVSARENQDGVPRY
jgi:CBS domain-containing protein